VKWRIPKYPQRKMTHMATKLPPFKTVWPTFGLDKCDCDCPATARVMVLISHTLQVLTFCGNHFSRLKASFDDLGYMYVDGRGRES
jgi:hypothetical protein